MKNPLFRDNTETVSARAQRRENATRAQKQANKLDMAVSYVIGTRPDVDENGNAIQVKQLALVFPKSW